VRNTKRAAPDPSALHAARTTPQELSRRYAEKDAKESELRLKLRDARGALAARERQLAGATKAMQRLSDERGRLQVGGVLGGLRGRSARWVL
jgi:chromosome segregation ATPase